MGHGGRHGQEPEFAGRTRCEAKGHGGNQNDMAKMTWREAWQRTENRGKDMVGTWWEPKGHGGNYSDVAGGMAKNRKSLKGPGGCQRNFEKTLSRPGANRMKDMCTFERERYL
jgi:hypothetical protein